MFGHWKWQFLYCINDLNLHFTSDWMATIMKQKRDWQVLKSEPDPTTLKRKNRPYPKRSWGILLKYYILCMLLQACNLVWHPKLFTNNMNRNCLYFPQSTHTVTVTQFLNFTLQCFNFTGVQQFITAGIISATHFICFVCCGSFYVVLFPVCGWPGLH